MVVTTPNFKLLQSQELMQSQSIKEISAEEGVDETTAPTEDSAIASDGRYHDTN